MTTQELNSRIATAYHEAGHVMAFIQSDIRFQYVTIKPWRGYLGRVKHKPQPRSVLTKSFFLNPSFFSKRFKRDIIYFAGALAEGMFLQDTEIEQAGCHDDILKTFSTCADLSDELREKYIQFAITYTKDLMIHNWGKVTAIAEGLLEHETLSYQEVLAIANESVANQITS